MGSHHSAFGHTWLTWGRNFSGVKGNVEVLQESHFLILYKWVSTHFQETSKTRRGGYVLFLTLHFQHFGTCEVFEIVRAVLFLFSLEYVQIR